LFVGLEVSESGDDLEAVVDGVCAAAALPGYLAVFESGDDVFDAGSDSAVLPVVVVADDAAGAVTPWCGDGVDAATQARGASQAKRARAGQVAARIVATHGNTITVEDCSISTWARLWGKRIALFSPGMLVAALKRECKATGGTLARAGTRSTALSQHCLCGARVPKTLAQRTHDCPHCGLRGDRDIVSAALAACVILTDPDDPRTARVDYRLAHALRAWLASQQEWEGSVNRHQPPPSPDAGSARTGSHHPVASAEQAALGPPPNSPGTPGRRGPSRKQPAPKLIGAA